MDFIICCESELVKFDFMVPLLLEVAVSLVLLLVLLLLLLLLMLLLLLLMCLSLLPSSSITIGLKSISFSILAELDDADGWLEASVESELCLDEVTDIFEFGGDESSFIDAGVLIVRALLLLL